MAAPAVAPQAETVRFAVLAFRPKPETLKRWQPIADYLNAQGLQARFELEVLTYPELEEAVRLRHVDVVLTQPALYILLSYREGLYSPLATLVERDGENVLASFGGVVVTQAGRDDIRGLGDLRGKRIATSAKESLGGFQAQAMELLDLGIDPNQDISVLQTGMPHDKVIDAVLTGRADAGFVRSGLLEQMTREGKLAPDRLKVLAIPSVPAYPLALSTRLYPEWALAAMPWVDADLARQVAAALLSLPHGGKVARAAAIEGFTIPGDYHVVDQAMRALHAPPFDQQAEHSLREFWAAHRDAIAAFAVLLSLIPIGLWLALRRSHRRLAEEHRNLISTSEALQATSLRQRIILSSLGEGVFGIDTDGAMTFINPAALAMLGYREEELLGEDAHALFHFCREDGSPYAADECPIHRTLRDGQQRSTEEWFWKHGGRDGFPAWLTVSPKLEEGEIRGCVVVFNDITTRKRAEQELEATGVLFQNIFQLTPIAAAISDLETGCYVFVNDAYVKTFGWTTEQIRGRSSIELGQWENPAVRLQWVAEIKAQGVTYGFPAASTTSANRPFSLCSTT